MQADTTNGLADKLVRAQDGEQEEEDPSQSIVLAHGVCIYLPILKHQRY
jgi:hypothetical protein